MPLDDFESRLPELADLHVPLGKYSITFQEKEGWECHGEPVRAKSTSSRFPFLNSTDYFAHNMSGAIAGRETRNVPEYPIFLGQKLPPAHIRAMTFLGEHMSDAEFQDYLVRHEVGHAAFNRDMAVILQRMVPGNELAYLKAMSALAKYSREEGHIPLSKLYDSGVYPTDEERFLEDLADMYSIYAGAMAKNNLRTWSYYKQLVLRTNSGLESLFAVIEELFNESQNPHY